MPIRFFTLTEVDKEVISPHYSTAYGETVKGEKVEMGRYVYQKETGAELHQHPEEQIICLVSGRVRVTANGQEFEIGPGDAVLVPPGTVHSTYALEESHFFSFKDLVPKG